jgi:hypothetical protein
MSQLFDKAYTPSAGSNPQKYMTSFDGFNERVPTRKFSLPLAGDHKAISPITGSSAFSAIYVEMPAGMPVESCVIYPFLPMLPTGIEVDFV